MNVFMHENHIEAPTQPINMHLRGIKMSIILKNEQDKAPTTKPICTIIVNSEDEVAER